MSRPNKNPENSAQPLELIDASDFVSMKLQFHLTNTTTQTTVKNNKAIRLIELQNRGLTLEVPSPSCHQGHNIILEITGFDEHKNEFKFSSTAKVEHLESVQDNMDRIDITLVQYDEKAWENFCHRFSHRQNEITDFFERAKGLK